MRFPYFFLSKITPYPTKTTSRRAARGNRVDATSDVEPRNIWGMSRTRFELVSRRPEKKKKQRGTPLSKSLRKVGARRRPRNSNESTTMFFRVVLDIFSCARNSENFSVPLPARPGPVLRRTSSSPTRHARHLPMTKKRVSNRILQKMFEARALIGTAGFFLGVILGEKNMPRFPLRIDLHRCGFLESGLPEVFYRLPHRLNF